MFWERERGVHDSIERWVGVLGQSRVKCLHDSVER